MYILWALITFLASSKYLASILIPSLVCSSRDINESIDSVSFHLRYILVTSGALMFSVTSSPVGNGNLQESLNVSEVE